MAHPSEDRGTGPDAYRELFERSADAILIIEGETFVDCNEAAVRMLRYSNKAELLRTHPSELSPPHQPDGRSSYEKANEMIALAFEKGSHRFEWDHRRADGEVFPVEVLLTAVQEPERRVLHVVWRDITERKRLEAHLRQAQKMEAVGKLAGGIAHDFNNVLVAIIANAELLELWTGDDEKAQRSILEIRKAADRAAALVRQLLAFSRKQEVMPQVLNLNELIGDVRELLERLIGEDVRLIVDVCSTPLMVRADAGQIEQVVLNLVANARDALPDGGSLTVRTHAAKEDDRAEALLSVSDDGTGMSRDTAARAFEPFFTTKELGKGTGLGLATVYGIVKAAGGTVALDSREGHGTRVEVRLPLTEDAPASPATGSRRGSPVTRGAGELILLVEDEAAVRALGRRLLEDNGYRVLTARDGREAQSLYLRDQGEFALIVTDVIMPRMGGVELLLALREAGHSPRVLFVSGYTDDALSRLRRLGEDVNLLEKPFSTKDLLERVRGALDLAREEPKGAG